MKKLGTLAVAMLLVSQLTAQAAFSCGFETASECAGWVFQNNSTGANRWIIGQGTAHEGQYALYVSYNSGTTCSYQLAKSSNLFATCTIELTAGTYTYNYDCRVGGEVGADYMQAMLVGADYDPPTTGTATAWAAPSSAIMLQSVPKLSLTDGWVSQSGTFAVETGGNYKLLFYWRNDGDGGTAFSVAIDNISIALSEDDTSLAVDTSAATYAVALVASNPLYGTLLGAGAYPAGSTVSIAAVPRLGYAFGGWSDGDTANPRLLTLSSDIALVAHFLRPDTTCTPDTVRDTIYRHLYHHDTVTLRDTVHDTLRTTVFRTDTVTRHDTVQTTVYHTDTVTVSTTFRDTVVVDYYRTDTIVLRDTVPIDYYHTDTFVMLDTVWQTTYLHDTVHADSVVHDTVKFTHRDTVYVDRLMLDTVIFTRYDTVERVETHHDTLLFTDTVTRLDTITLIDTVFDTIYIYRTDTVYDTVLLSTPSPMEGAPLATISTDGGYIIIDNLQSQPVAIFDATGRLLSTYTGQSRVRFCVPSAGTYLIRIGNRYTQRVVVIK